MILSKTNSWIREELLGHKETAPRYCYIQDIVNAQDHRFFISDGIYFIKSTIPQKSFLELTKRYNQDSLQLKGSIILARKHVYMVKRDNRVEMVLEDCVYLGEGNLSGETRDINDIVDSRCLFLMKSNGHDNQNQEACEATRISNDLSKNRNILNFNSPSKHEKYFKYNRTEGNSAITQTQPLCEAKVLKFIESRLDAPITERKKPHSRQPITESFIMSIDKVDCSTEGIIGNPQIKDLQMISIDVGEPSNDNYLSHISSIRSSCLMHELFADSLETNDKEEESFNFSDISNLSSAPATSATSGFSFTNKTKSDSLAGLGTMLLSKDTFDEIHFIKKGKSHRRDTGFCLVPLNKLSMANRGGVVIHKKNALMDFSNKKKRSRSKFMIYSQTESTDAMLSQSSQKIFRTPKIFIIQKKVLGSHNLSSISSERIMLRRERKKPYADFSIRLHKIRMKCIEDDRRSHKKNNKDAENSQIKFIKCKNAQNDIVCNNRKASKECILTQNARPYEISFMRPRFDVKGHFDPKRLHINREITKLNGNNTEDKTADDHNVRIGLFLGDPDSINRLMHQQTTLEPNMCIKEDERLHKLIQDGHSAKCCNLAFELEKCKEPVPEEDNNSCINTDADPISINLCADDTPFVSQDGSFFNSEINVNSMVDKILESSETVENSSISFQKVFFSLSPKQLQKTGGLELCGIPNKSDNNEIKLSGTKFKDESPRNTYCFFKDESKDELSLTDATEDTVIPLVSDCQYPDFVILEENESVNNFIDFLVV